MREREVSHLCHTVRVFPQELPTAVLRARRGEDAGTRDLEHLHGCVRGGPHGDGRHRVRHHSQARQGALHLVQRGASVSYLFIRVLVRKFCLLPDLLCILTVPFRRVSSERVGN